MLGWYTSHLKHFRLAHVTLFHLPLVMEIPDARRMMQEPKSVLIEQQPVRDPAAVPNDRPLRIVRDSMERFRAARPLAADRRLRSGRTGVVQQSDHRAPAGSPAHARCGRMDQV